MYQAAKLVFAYAFAYSVPVPCTTTDLVATRFNARISVESVAGLELAGLTQLYATILPIQFRSFTSAESADDKTDVCA